MKMRVACSRASAPWNWPTPMSSPSSTPLQATLTRRVSHGFKVLANFVYSKDMDNASGGSEGSAGPNNPFNLNDAAYGPADFNQKFRTNVSVNYLEAEVHTAERLRP